MWTYHPGVPGHTGTGEVLNLLLPVVQLVPSAELRYWEEVDAEPLLVEDAEPELQEGGGA